MSNTSREERAADIERAYRAGFNTAIILSEHICRGKADDCADEIIKLKKPSWPKRAAVKVKP